MKALSIVSEGDIQLVEKDTPEPAGNNVLIKLKAVALNKRDQFIRDGQYPGIKFGSTLGSDGVGVVEQVSDESNNHLLGQRVIINPNINWGSNPDVQGPNYNILGMPSDGTFAEYVSVDVDRLHAVPTHLNDVEAAGIPLAGLTAFRACFFHGKMTKRAKVLISGFGGGVAQFAFQFALAAGADVYVTSGSEEKVNKAMELGAIDGFNYHDKEWSKNAFRKYGGFDIVIDSSGGDQLNTLVRLMKPGGRIVFYGATNGLPESIDLYRMFWNQLTLQGSTMGNDGEFSDMLDFVGRHKIVPIMDSVRPFREIVSAFDTLATSNRIGKLVINYE